MSDQTDVAAARIVRALTGGRWTWPPVQVREVYPVLTGKQILRGKPVIEVVSAKNYDTGDDLSYTLFKGGWIHLTGPQQGGACSPLRLDVTYTYGSEPSQLMKNAISVLSKEMALSESDSVACRIPERVTSVSRQGVSWTLIDPQEFLAEGRTGIYEIDLAIRAAGGSRRRSRVFSTEYPVPDRLETTILPIPA